MRPNPKQAQANEAQQRHKNHRIRNFRQFIHYSQCCSISIRYRHYLGRMPRLADHRRSPLRIMSPFAPSTSVRLKRHPPRNEFHGSQPKTHSRGLPGDSCP
jgi:hypothetical protein